MKSKLLIFLFVVVVGILGVSFYFSKKKVEVEENSLTRAKVIKPQSSQSSLDESEENSSILPSEKYETFIPLELGETLISTLTVDINNDGYDDEILIVRKSSSPYIQIIPAISDSETGIFTRLEAIQTKFAKTRTFSYSGIDVIGNHKNSLVYQGLDDDGNYILQIYLYDENQSKNSLINIGNFSCDGTVFIQQTERPESYELSLSNAESFSVWVYKSEQTINSQESQKKSIDLNQIQQEFKWNEQTQKYELSREIHVTAGKLAANELSKIQDGTVETFVSFLNGLWYKTSNTGNSIRYFYFNYENKEIIQLYEDTQEVYEWEDSKLRHNGIYLTAVNADIMNLNRRFDISLKSVDEIKITARDSLNLLIKENTLWDGEYKKMPIRSEFENDDSQKSLNEILNELKKTEIWQSNDLEYEIQFKDFTYNLKSTEIEENGVFSSEKIGSYNLIHFKSDNLDSILNKTYSVNFGKKIITETVKKKKIEKTVDDLNKIIFTPVKVTPKDCFPTEGKILTFEKIS